MARAHRWHDDGGIFFHITHRCHNRAFLLKFARDRDAYREKLREALPQFDVCLLDYCLTSNHVHLLIDAPRRKEVSGLMQKAAGEFARAYNHRKSRTIAFWGDNFHATLAEGGQYLWQCLRYIELNMVRCGVVQHPPATGIPRDHGPAAALSLVGLAKTLLAFGHRSIRSAQNRAGCDPEGNVGARTNET